MFKMCKLNFMRQNRGSATVEMCFVLPIVLWIVVNVIYIFLDVIGDSASQGECYSAIYMYSEEQREEEGKYSQPVFVVEHNLVCQGKELGGGSSEYIYQGNANTYKTEYDLCTMRLRRWQLYGDVLRE